MVMYKVTSNGIVPTESSEKKPVPLEQLIYRAISSLRVELDSRLSKIERVQESILSRQEALHLAIGHTVSKMETFGNQVNSLTNVVLNPPEKPSSSIFEKEWSEADREWLNSLTNSPLRISSPDIRCYETMSCWSPLPRDPIFPSTGTTDPQGSGKADEPMLSSPTPSLRNPEPSGGADTYLNNL